MADFPDPSTFASLVDLLDDAARRYPHDRPTLSLRTDEGTSHAWSAAELRRRARLAAWRLRALGVAPGDRLLTWSPSTPALPAVFWGASIAGAVLVPLDLRMSPTVLQRIAGRSGARVLAMGTGPDAPDPVAAGLTQLDLGLVTVAGEDAARERELGVRDAVGSAPWTSRWATSSKLDCVARSLMS